MNINRPLTSLGYTLDLSPHSFGELRSSADALSDAGELRRRQVEDGYLYIPGFFDRSLIETAREEFIRRLQTLGALHPDHPAEAAIPCENAPYISQAIAKDNTLLRDVVFAPQLDAFYHRLLGGGVRHYDHIWVRVVKPGSGTPPHCDLVYMGRGTREVWTGWVPYSDVALEIGGLMILEKSHCQAERLRNYLATDVDAYCENRGPYKHKSGWLTNNPVTLREKLGGRWLTAEYRMGDLLTFGMKTIHASLDNQSQVYRLSTDTRYQLASEPIDERWIGPDTVEYAEKNRIGKIC